MKGHCKAKVTSRQPEEGNQATDNQTKGSFVVGDQIKHFYGLKSWREGGKGSVQDNRCFGKKKEASLSSSPSPDRKAFAVPNLARAAGTRPLSAPLPRHAGPHSYALGCEIPPDQRRPPETHPSHPSQMSQSCLKQTPTSAFARPKANLEVSGRPRHILAAKSLTAAGADVQNPSHRGFFGWVSRPAAMWASSHLHGEAQPCAQG